LVEVSAYSVLEAEVLRGIEVGEPVEDLPVEGQN
jgi:hypothetical protein